MMSKKCSNQLRSYNPLHSLLSFFKRKKCTEHFLDFFHIEKHRMKTGVPIYHIEQDLAINALSQNLSAHSSPSFAPVPPSLLSATLSSSVPS